MKYFTHYLLAATLEKHTTQKRWFDIYFHGV